MKKEMKTAEIISVKDASFVNPLGTVLSGVTRSGAPLNLAGSGERWKVLFRCEDDSLFEATIWCPGSHFRAERIRKNRFVQCGRKSG